MTKIVFHSYRRLFALSMGAVLVVAMSNVSAGGDRTRLECRASGAGDTSMDARYEKESARTRFATSFEAAPGGAFQAGDILPVAVEGVVVGDMLLEVQANLDIGGDLEFDTTAGPGDKAQPFPDNFPAVGSGSSVVVGTLGCTL